MLIAEATPLKSPEGGTRADRFARPVRSLPSRPRGAFEDAVLGFEIEGREGLRHELAAAAELSGVRAEHPGLPGRQPDGRAGRAARHAGAFASRYSDRSGHRASRPTSVPCTCRAATSATFNFAETDRPGVYEVQHKDAVDSAVRREPVPPARERHQAQGPDRSATRKWRARRCASRPAARHGSCFCCWG